MRLKMNTKKNKGFLFALLFATTALAQDTSPDSAKNGQLDEVVATGTRTAPRTNVSSPLPIDNFLAKDLQATGQPTFDKAMQYRVPSFNTVNTPVNDATALIDPWEIRNMGPSRTLILVNGKRKNSSSLLMLQYSPGRGEMGADISAIPQDAIKSVEFLRDGASAQYGSDAIAGVINIVLKDKYDFTTVNLNSGLTSKGDGFNFSASLNSGKNFGNKGFVNYTAQYQKMNPAFRNGDVTAEDESKLWGTEFFRYDLPVTLRGGTASNETFSKENVDKFLSNHKSGAGTPNGTSDIAMYKALINAGIPFGNSKLLYFNAAYVYKTAKNNAFYRMTYWPGAGTFGGAGGLFGTPYDGFIPTFEGKLNDYNGTVGFKNTLQDGWNYDLSLTLGGNTQTYEVNNSFNPALTSSPTSFKPGGYAFHHIVGNIDVNRTIGEMFSIGFGSEIRRESFEIKAGDTASYVGAGAQSFTGMETADAGTYSRTNIGVYASVDFTPAKSFLLNGTGRFENYSDFGSAFVWKASARYTIAKGLSLRASASTGFRAPSLAQIYQQGRFSNYVPGQGVDLSKLYNNSDLAKSLGIPQLKAENSINYTAGIAYQVNKKISLSVDYYYINVKDRIFMTAILQDTIKTGQTEIGNADNKKNGAYGSNFFLNGLETTTQGLDIVASIRNINAGKGKFSFNLAGNFVLANEINKVPTVTDKMKTIGVTALFNEESKYLTTKSRPSQKIILGIDYEINHLHINLNNTFFGTTQFVHDAASGNLITGPLALMEKGIVQEFQPAVVTDLSISYQFTKQLSASFTVNNLLNILPTWKLVGVTDEGKTLLAGQTSNGAPTWKSAFTESTVDYLTRGITMANRFPITGKNGSHFSQLGTQFFLAVSYRF